MTSKLQLEVSLSLLKKAQEHADELYRAADEKGFKMAGWHAHEVSRNLSAVGYRLQELIKEKNE